MKHNWEYKTFGEIGYFLRGKGIQKTHFVEKGLPCIHYGQIHTVFGVSTNSHISEIPQDLYDQSIIASKGDVLLTLTSEDVEGSCKSTAWLGDYDVAMSSDAAVFKHNMNPKFIVYYSKSKPFFIEKSKYARGFKVTHIKTSDIASIPIPVPSLPTQQSIVSELDTLSGIIAECKETLKDYDSLEQSIFYDMFGDPVKNEKGWVVKKLGEVGNLARGVSKHRPRNAPELLGGTMPLIQTGDVANADFFIEKYTNTYSELGVAQSKVWKKGTLCITIAATIGKCAILNFDACFPDSVVGFEPNNEISEKIYILFLFKNLQKILEEEAPAVAQKNINLALLNNLTVPLPPLSLQQNFASKIEAIEQMKVETKKALQEAETLFQARMDYWFN